MVLGLDLAGVLVLAVVLVVVAVLGRRVYLRRLGGSIDCAVRTRPRGGGRGWRLGVARFGADTMDWYRLFSLWPLTGLRVDRRSCQVLERRPPSGPERRALQPGVEVVRVSCRGRGAARDVELALAPPAVTVLLTWLESAPPGTDFDRGPAR